MFWQKKRSHVTIKLMLHVASAHYAAIFSFVKFLRGQVRVLRCHFSEKEIEYYDSLSSTVVDISKLTVVNFIFTKCLMPVESWFTEFPHVQCARSNRYTRTHYCVTSLILSVSQVLFCDTKEVRRTHLHSHLHFWLRVLHEEENSLGDIVTSVTKINTVSMKRSTFFFLIDSSTEIVQSYSCSEG